LDTVIEQREAIMQNGIQIKGNYGEVL
jgi:hypothetical protein